MEHILLPVGLIFFLVSLFYFLDSCQARDETFGVRHELFAGDRSGTRLTRSSVYFPTNKARTWHSRTRLIMAHNLNGFVLQEERAAPRSWPLGPKEKQVIFFVFARPNTKVPRISVLTVSSSRDTSPATPSQDPPAFDRATNDTAPCAAIVRVRASTSAQGITEFRSSYRRIDSAHYNHDRCAAWI